MDANGPSQDSRSSGSTEEGIVRYTHASPNWVRAISAPIARGIQSTHNRQRQRNLLQIRCAGFTKYCDSLSIALQVLKEKNLISLSERYLPMYVDGKLESTLELTHQKRW
jgi:hypothetical protein